MALDLSTYKVANLETSSDTKFNNLVQAVQDAFNALGDTSKGGFTTGLIFDPAQLKQNAAATGDRLVWNGSTWGPVTGGITRLYDSTLGASTANFNITPISGTYNHLRVVALLRGDKNATQVLNGVQFNGDVGANYDFDTSLTTTAVAASENLAATSFFGVYAPALTATANYFGTMIIDIPCYAQTTANKTFTYQGYFRTSTAANAGSANVGGGMWRSTAAITRIQIFPDSGNWIAGSRVTVYGLT